jgi:hypothetical protein
MMVPEEISMIVSSDPSQGATNISPDGSYFEVQLQDGLMLPKDALNINIAVEESTVWWVVPNIITGVNDKMYLTGSTSAGVAQNFNITIPNGLYDLSGLNNAISRELELAGAKNDPDALITLNADEATQKVEIRFNYDDVSIDFSQPNTFAEILGFSSAAGDNPFGPYISAPISILATDIAAFNTVNYFLIHGDLTNKGIRFNNNYNQTLGQVLIDVPPGSQITSNPRNPAKVNAPELGGSTRTNLRFWITDDKNRRVNMNNEYWSARIVIHYLRPFVIGRPIVS